MTGYERKGQRGVDRGQGVERDINLVTVIGAKAVVGAGIELVSVQWSRHKVTRTTRHFAGGCQAWTCRQEATALRGGHDSPPGREEAADRLSKNQGTRR